MSNFTTVFGSLDNFEKGHIEIIDDDPKNYAFSNMFEVANNSDPYEKVPVAKNLENVIEVLRADGVSPWYTNAHDEFALVVDGEVEVHVYIATTDEQINDDLEGTHPFKGDPSGQKIGWCVLKRGHQCILPSGSVYQFRARKAGVILQQTIQGPLTTEKWKEICLQ